MRGTIDAVDNNIEDATSLVSNSDLSTSRATDELSYHSYADFPGSGRFKCTKEIKLDSPLMRGKRIMALVMR